MAGFPSLIASDANQFSYGPKGEMAPESALKEQALNRRRQIANLMIQKGMAGSPGGKMVGRFYVADSPLQGAAGLANVLAGGLGNMALDSQQKDIASADQKMVADARDAYAKAIADKVQRKEIPIQATRAEMPDTWDVNELTGGPTVGMQASEKPVQGPIPRPGDTRQHAAWSPVPPEVEMPKIPIREREGSLPTTQTTMIEEVTKASPEEKRAALAELLTHQHPQVRAYGQLLAAMQQKQEEAGRDQSNKDRAFGLDERALQSRADETRALRESTDAYRQAQLGAQLTGMGINAENARQTRDIQQQNADRAAAHDKVLEKLGLMDAETKRMQLNQGKVPPGYRSTKDGTLEAIPGGPADTKLQGVLNQDTAIMNSSTAGLDRLASSANQILNHPGLAGVTGIRGKLPDIPGTNAADARALLEKLKSQVAFDVLQDMRNNSKTGGALGNVSDAEGKRLENNLAALNSAQSIDQFKKELQSVIEFTNGAKDRLRDAFNMKHKGVMGEQATSKPSASGALSADEQAELEALRKKYGR